MPKDSGLTLHWQQFIPYGASILFVVKETPRSSCWLLTGCEPIFDDWLVDLLLDGMPAIDRNTPDELVRTVRSLRRRPAAIYFPFTAAPDKGLRYPLGRVVGCFAATFFDEIAESLATAHPLDVERARRLPAP